MIESFVRWGFKPEIFTVNYQMLDICIQYYTLPSTFQKSIE